jgi:O-antigen/teichoic acid export membrane protein
MTTAASQEQAPRGSHRILKRFGYLFSAHWIREALQAGFMIYLARAHQDTFGQFSVALNVGYILRFIAECGLNQQLATLLARKADYPTALLTQFTILKSALLGLAWLGMLAFVFWQDYDATLFWLTLIIGTAVGLEALNSSFFVVYQILGRQDVEGRLRTVGAVFGFGYGFAALYAGGGPIAVSFFKLVESAVNLFGALYGVFGRVKLRVDWEHLRAVWRTWKEGIVFTLMAILAIFFNKINVFFLQNSGGAVGVAQYSVAWSTVEGVSTLVSSMLLGKVMFPILAKLWVNNENAFRTLSRDAARWLIAAGLLLVFAIAIESDRIVTLIYGASYADAIWMQQVLAPTIFLAYIHNLAGYMMLSSQAEKPLLWFYVAGLTMNVILCAWLIPLWPLLGSALAILLTKVFVAILTVSYCQRRFRFLPGRSLLHMSMAGALGAGLYFGGQRFLFREAGEVLAILPMLALAWRWRKEFTQAKERAEG